MRFASTLRCTVVKGPDQKQPNRNTILLYCLIGVSKHRSLCMSKRVPMTDAALYALFRHLDFCMLITVNPLKLCLAEAGWSALHFAAAGGHASVIAELLAHGARLQPDCQGRLPLHLAALTGGDDTTAALLRSSQSEVGHTPVLPATGLPVACPCLAVHFQPPSSRGIVLPGTHVRPPARQEHGRWAQAGDRRRHAHGLCCRRRWTRGMPAAAQRCTAPLRKAISACCRGCCSTAQWLASPSRQGPIPAQCSKCMALSS